MIGTATISYVCLICWVSLALGLRPSTFTIGIIEGPEDDPRQSGKRFWSIANNFTSQVSLVPVVSGVRWWDTLEITRAICELLHHEVDSLVSISPTVVRPVLASYARSFELPMITISSDRNTRFRFKPDVNLVPDTNQAIADILKYYKWKYFVFFYDDDDGPMKLEEILRLANQPIDVEAVWRVSNGEECRRLLDYVENQGTVAKGDTLNVLFATRQHLVSEIVTDHQISEVKARKYHFILTEPNIGKIRRFFFRSTIVTELSLGERHTAAFQSFEPKWRSLLSQNEQILPLTTYETLKENILLYYDAASLMSKSLFRAVQDSALAKRENSTKVRMKCLSDSKDYPPVPSQNGMVIANYMKTTALENGITGNIQFNTQGERKNFTFGVVETFFYTMKIGTWSDVGGLKISNSRNTSKELQDDPTGSPEENSKSEQTLIVTAILTTPYLMPSKDERAVGNDRYIGFMKDLLDQLFDNLKFSYEIRLVKDGRYGSYRDGAWNGMIGEIIRKDADMAIADLTVTRSREEVIDFSVPFMSVGLNIMMKKSASSLSEEDTRVLLTPFGFFTAFAYDTWLILIVVYLLISAGLFAVSSFTGVPDRIRSVDTKGSDRLSICSSFWFAAGSLFLQSTAVYPRSLSHRVITVVWWAFTLVTVVVYVCSLSSLFIVERTKDHGILDPNIGSLQLLKKSLERSFPRIGSLHSGSTAEFFRKSEIGIYKDFGTFLQNNPDVATKSYAEGVARVRASNGSYGFISESAASEYISNRAPCDIVATSGSLDFRSYSIALRKGSPLKQIIDEGLMDMMETGALRQIYEKWWHSERACDDSSLDVLPGIYSSSLSLAEVSGVFYLLIIGSAVACISAGVEYFIQSKHLSVDK